MTLLEILKQIRDSGPRQSDAGICYNVALIDEGVARKYSEITQLVKQWPEGFSDKQFPVEGGFFYWKAKDEGTLWENPRRLALLDWCIEQLEKEAAEIPE